MKTPFSYQATEYDCVPTTFINALQYLFHRDEIPPVVIQKIMMYSLDKVGSNGEWGKHGTTDTAIQHILKLLSSYPDGKFQFKIYGR